MQKNRKAITSILISVILFITLASDVRSFAAINTNMTIKSATEFDYPPFSVTSGGYADGFSVDLLKAVADEVGLDISFKIDHWNTIKGELERGELDVYH